MECAYDLSTPDGRDEFEDLVIRTLEEEVIRHPGRYNHFSELEEWFFDREAPIEPVRTEDGFEARRMPLTSDGKKARRIVRAVAKTTIRELA